MHKRSYFSYYQSHQKRVLALRPQPGVWKGFNITELSSSKKRVDIAHLPNIFIYFLLSLFLSLSFNFRKYILNKGFFSVKRQSSWFVCFFKNKCLRLIYSVLILWFTNLMGHFLTSPHLKPPSQMSSFSFSVVNFSIMKYKTF